MKFAVDVMSGEKPPAEIIKGAVEAAEELDIQVILVGDDRVIQGALNEQPYNSSRVSIEHCDEIIGMHEAPSAGIRQKKRASVVVCAKLVREKRAVGFFSPGNTGATLAAALLNLKRLHRIKRPVLVSIFPNEDYGKLIIGDMGANVDCGPDHLYQFAVLMHAFAKWVLREDAPRIGLMNVGEEEKKGNHLYQRAHAILKHSPMNFFGNVEGNDIFSNKVDVIVCDGFTGNVILKTIEGTISTLTGVIKKEVKKSILAMVGAFLMSGKLKFVTKEVFNKDKYGGAPLIGLNGVVLVGHGSSNADAVKSGLALGKDVVRYHLNEHIEQLL